MKKIIITLLAICLLAALCAVPVCAAEWDKPQAAYTPRWLDWFRDYREPAPAETTVPPETEAPTEEPTEAPTEPPATEYKIKYDCNGGYFFSMYASPSVFNTKTVTVEAGKTLTVSDAPERNACYAFRGWQASDGAIYQPGDKITPTENMTMKAVWEYME